MALPHGLITVFCLTMILFSYFRGSFNMDKDDNKPAYEQSQVKMMKE